LPLHPRIARPDAANFDGEFSRTTAGYAGKGSVRYAW
jgi:hypothetical protein